MKLQKFLVLALLATIILSEVVEIEEETSLVTQNDIPVCGNKKIEDNEECQIEKKNSFDPETEECRDCLIVPICGNGVLNPEKGEECDPEALDTFDDVTQDCVGCYI